MAEAKRIFFVSTNKVWSGSEVLWFETAKRLAFENFIIGVAVPFRHDKIEGLKQVVHMCIQPGPQGRNKVWKWSKRLQKLLKRNHDEWAAKLDAFKPDLVVISQGADFASRDIMALCSEKELPYITVTQLVNDFQWLSLNEQNIDLFRKLYGLAKANFFVSQQNLKLHELKLGYSSMNNEVIWNPVVTSRGILPFPENIDTWRLAFVGRMECFHKGLDLLIEVMSMKKWRERPIHVSLYGDGPHRTMLMQLIETRGLTHVTCCEAVQDVSVVWRKNHLAIMPSRMEGQSLALLEALAHGRSAVVTDVGGALELIQDDISGFVCQSITVGGLDEALERAWSRRDAWQQMGTVCYEQLMQVMPGDAVGVFKEKVVQIATRQR